MGGRVGRGLCTYIGVLESSYWGQRQQRGDLWNTNSLGNQKVKLLNFPRRVKGVGGDKETNFPKNRYGKNCGILCDTRIATFVGIIYIHLVKREDRRLTLDLRFGPKTDEICNSFFSLTQQGILLFSFSFSRSSLFTS